jgi:DUF1680 family protein
MQPQRVRASEEIQATRGRVALRYGPLMYSVESADQSDAEAWPRNAEVLTEWRPDLLEGVMVLKSTFADGVDVRAIPNYARNNRLSAAPADGGGGLRRRGGGGGESRVWLREAE